MRDWDGPLLSSCRPRSLALPPFSASLLIRPGRSSIWVEPAGRSTPLSPRSGLPADPGLSVSLLSPRSWPVRGLPAALPPFRSPRSPSRSGLRRLPLRLPVSSRAPFLPSPWTRISLSLDDLPCLVSWVGGFRESSRPLFSPSPPSRSSRVLPGPSLSPPFPNLSLRPSRPGPFWEAASFMLLELCFSAS